MKKTLRIILVGTGATLLIDTWSWLLNLAGLRSQGVLLIGRWVTYMKEGIFKHENILHVQAAENEVLTGYIAHYTIGIFFAFLLVYIYGDRWLSRPTFLPAMTIALSTLIFPLFIVQPLLGFGPAFSNLSHQYYLLARLLVVHIIYGAGLILSARLFQAYSLKLIPFKSW